MANVKLWVWNLDCTSPVKLTLREGQTLRTTQGGETDEGWYRETHYWSFDGDIVTHEWMSRQRDCDGLYEHGGSSICLRDRVAKGGDNGDGVSWPDWQQTENHHRDHSAEAMGY